MASQSPTFAQKIRRFWLNLTGPDEPDEAALPPVIIHDPAAQRPHDLDDPFFDAKIQTRMADVIAHAGQK
jgi:hypothetical protein